jgi:hypothetical protein
VSERRYLKPPWMQRHVGNRLAPSFRRSLLSKLSVRGRRSGRWHTVPSPFWSTRASATSSPTAARVTGRSTCERPSGAPQPAGRVEEITVVEVPVGERGALFDVYSARYGTLPTVAGVLRALPDPADHPIFRLTATDESGTQTDRSPD